MPCSDAGYDDYCDSTTQRTARSRWQRTAKLIIFAYQKLDAKAQAPKIALDFARHAYAHSESTAKKLVPMLCALLNSFSPAQLERIVYDGHDKRSRQLADWWDDHKAKDAARCAREVAKRRLEQVKARARAKLENALTVEERKALGITLPRLAPTHINSEEEV